MTGQVNGTANSSSPESIDQPTNIHEVLKQFLQKSFNKEPVKIKLLPSKFDMGSKFLMAKTAKIAIFEILNKVNDLKNIKIEPKHGVDSRENDTSCLDPT